MTAATAWSGMYHHKDPEPLDLDTVRGYVEHYQFRFERASLVSTPIGFGLFEVASRETSDPAAAAPVSQGPVRRSPGLGGRRVGFGGELTFSWRWLGEARASK